MEAWYAKAASTISFLLQRKPPIRLEHAGTSGQFFSIPNCKTAHGSVLTSLFDEKSFPPGFFFSFFFGLQLYKPCRFLRLQSMMQPPPWPKKPLHRPENLLSIYYGVFHVPVVEFRMRFYGLFSTVYFSVTLPDGFDSGRSCLLKLLSGCST